MCDEEEISSTFVPIDGIEVELKTEEPSPPPKNGNIQRKEPETVTSLRRSRRKYRKRVPMVSSEYKKVVSSAGDDSVIYVCDVCRKEFVNFSSYRRHLYNHSGEKSYKCRVCKKSFNRSDHLKNHYRIHTGDKPFVCHVCKRRFTQRATLFNHLAMHTSVRAFVCSLCNESFARKVYLAKHVSNHMKRNWKNFKSPRKLKTTIQIHSEIKSSSNTQSGGVKYKDYSEEPRGLRLNGKENVCMICNATFSKEDALYLHIVKHIM